MAILWKTFGADNSCLDRLLEEHPDAEILVHMVNGVSRRKNNQYRGELFRHWSVNRFNHKLEKNALQAERGVKRRIEEISSYFQSQPQFTGKIILSLGLEDNYTDEAVTKLLKIARSVWHGPISRNPMDTRKNGLSYGGQRLNFVELHGLNVAIRHPARTIFSNDGIGIMFRSGTSVSSSVSPADFRRKVRQYRKRGSRVYVWWPEIQGLSGNSGNAAPPRRRRIAVELEHILTIRRIIK